jgi:hypothetical protein
MEDELVASGDATRRMDEYRVTDGAAFGIERFLDDKRPVVTTVREDGAPVTRFEFEGELRTPGVTLERICDVHEHLRIILRAVV